MPLSPQEVEFLMLRTRGALQELVQPETHTSPVYTPAASLGEPQIGGLIRACEMQMNTITRLCETVERFMSMALDKAEAAGEEQPTVGEPVKRPRGRPPTKTAASGQPQGASAAAPATAAASPPLPASSHATEASSAAGSSSGGPAAAPSAPVPSAPSTPAPGGNPFETKAAQPHDTGWGGVQQPKGNGSGDGLDIPENLRRPSAAPAQTTHPAQPITSGQPIVQISKDELRKILIEYSNRFDPLGAQGTTALDKLLEPFGVKRFTDLAAEHYAAVAARAQEALSKGK